jgi:Pvc16 N-terminal domain
MLDDLDRTLRGLIGAEVADLPADHLHFEPPDGDFTPAVPAVNLFLYDVRENRQLRSNDWQLDRPGDGSVTKRRTPRRVDCSYLITAWAGDPLSEHLLLGQVLHALLRSPVIGGDIPQGQLAGQELPTSILQPTLLQGIGEFWQAMGNKPRAAVHLTVTVAVDTGVSVTTTEVREPAIRIISKGES